MSDPAVSLDSTLKIIEIMAIIGGGSLALIAGGRVAGRVETAITTLQEDVRELNKLVRDVAVQGQRIDLIEKRYEELRHGEGFVFPDSPIAKAFRTQRGG